MAGQIFGAIGDATKEFFNTREDLRKQRESERLAQEQLDNQKAQLDLQKQSQEWNRLQTFNTRLKDQDTWLKDNVDNLPPEVVSKYQEMIQGGQSRYDEYLQTGDSSGITSWRQQYYGWMDTPDRLEPAIATYMDGTIEKKVRLSELYTTAYENAKVRKFSEPTKDALGVSGANLYATMMVDPSTPEATRTAANEIMKGVLSGKIDRALGAAQIFALQGATTPDKMAQQLLVNPTDPTLAKAAQHYYESMPDSSKYELDAEGKPDKSRPSTGYTALERQLASPSVKQSIETYDLKTKQTRLETERMTLSNDALSDQSRILNENHVSDGIANGNLVGLAASKTRIEALGYDYEAVITQATKNKTYIDNSKDFADKLGSDSVQMSKYNLTTTRISTEQMTQLDAAIRPLMIDGAKVDALLKVATSQNGLTTAQFTAEVLPDMLRLANEGDKGDLLNRIAMLPGGLGKILADGMMQNGAITSDEFGAILTLNNDIEAVRKNGVEVTLSNGVVQLGQNRNTTVQLDTLFPRIADTTNNALDAQDAQNLFNTADFTARGARVEEITNAQADNLMLSLGVSNDELNAKRPFIADYVRAQFAAEMSGLDLKTLDNQSKLKFVEAVNEASANADIAKSDLSTLTDTERLKYVSNLILSLSKRDISVAGLETIQADVGSETAAAVIRSNFQTLLAQNGLRIKDATSQAEFIEVVNKVAAEAGISQNRLTKLTADENAKFVEKLIPALAAKSLSEAKLATTVATSTNTVATSLILSDAQRTLAANGLSILDATSKAKFVTAVNTALAGKDISEATLATMNAEGIKNYIDAYNVEAGKAKIAQLKYDGTNADEGRKLLGAVIAARDGASVATNINIAQAAEGAAPFVYNIAAMQGSATIENLKDTDTVRDATRPFLEAEATLDGKVKVRNLYGDAYMAQQYMLSANKLGKLKGESLATDFLYNIADKELMTVVANIKKQDAAAITKTESVNKKKELAYGRTVIDAMNKYAPDIEDAKQRYAKLGLSGDTLERIAGLPYRASIGMLTGEVNVGKLKSAKADLESLLPYIPRLNALASKLKLQGMDNDLAESVAYAPMAGAVGAGRGKDAVAKFQLSVAQSEGLLVHAKEIAIAYDKLKLQGFSNDMARLKALEPYIDTLTQTGATAEVARNVAGQSASYFNDAVTQGRMKTALSQGYTQGEATVANNQAAASESQNRFHAANVLSEYIPAITRGSAIATITQSEYNTQSVNKLMETLDYRSMLQNGDATIALAKSDPSGEFLKNPEFANEARAQGVYDLYKSTAAAQKATNEAAYNLALLKASKTSGSGRDPRLAPLSAESVLLRSQIDTTRKSANYKNNAAIVAGLDKSYITGDALTGFGLSATARTIGTVNANKEQVAIWASMSATGKQAFRALQADEAKIQGFNARLNQISARMQAISDESFGSPARTVPTNIPGAGGQVKFMSSPLFNSTIKAMGGNTAVVPMQELNNNPNNGYYAATNGHTGRDLAIGAPSPGMPGIMGAPIHAFGNLIGGKVVLAGPSGGTGNTVKVLMLSGQTVLLGHMQSVNVKVGDSVNANTILGKQGNTGSGWGANGNPIHVHMQVYDKNGKAVRDADQFEAALIPLQTGKTSTGFGTPAVPNGPRVAPLGPTGSAVPIAQPSPTGSPTGSSTAMPPAITPPGQAATTFGKKGLYQIPTSYAGKPLDTSLSIQIQGLLPKAIAQGKSLLAAYKPSGNKAKDDALLRKLSSDYDKYLQVESANIMQMIPTPGLTALQLKQLLHATLDKN